MTRHYLDHNAMPDRLRMHTNSYLHGHFVTSGVLL